MGLADKVIEANEKQERGYEVDELGIGIANTPDYIAARVLLINSNEIEEDSRAGRIHTRKNKTELWKGEHQLTKDKRTIYELANLQRSLKDYELEAVWKSLLDNTPELDVTKLVVDEHTYWDTEKCELVHTDMRLLTV